MLSPEFRRELQGYRASEVLREHRDRAPWKHPLSLIQYLDLKTHLPGDILTKVDRASMAHSLQVRVPFLDHKLAEWTCNPYEHYRFTSRYFALRRDSQITFACSALDD